MNLSLQKVMELCSWSYDYGEARKLCSKGKFLNELEKRVKEVEKE